MNLTERLADADGMAAVVGTLIERHARLVGARQRTDFDSGRMVGIEQTLALILDTNTTRIRQALTEWRQADAA